MKFNDHSRLIGCHAFLSASQYHWVNYDDDKLIERFNTYQASQRGTQLHEFAATCIELGQRLPRSPKTLNLYVNDAIGFHMTPEQVLYYSENCFGTTDAICFRNDFLRIRSRGGHTQEERGLPKPDRHLRRTIISGCLKCNPFHSFFR